MSNSFPPKQTEGVAAVFSTENARSLVGLAPVPHVMNSLLFPVLPLYLLFCQAFIKRNIKYFSGQFPVQLVVSLVGHNLLLGTLCS